MHTDPSILSQVKKWIAYGNDDLQLVKHSLLMESSCPYRLTAYHAQQCAEKYLKAFLVCNQIDFPYTHSVTRLIELVPISLWREDEQERIEALSVYAITTRYPGEDEEVTKDEALNAIRLAELVKDTVGNELKDVL